MNTLLVKASAIALVFSVHASFGMVTTGSDKKNDEQFDFLSLPEDLQKGFVAHFDPSIRNQLKNTSTAMNTMCAKKAPNMYGLVPYDLNATAKDVTFIMFNAAHDKNLKVMENVERTKQQNYLYIFPTHTYFQKQSYGMSICGMLIFSEETGNEEILNKILEKEFDYIKITPTPKIINATPLLRACFLGRPDLIAKQLPCRKYLDDNPIAIENNPITINDSIRTCVSIAIDQDNADLIGQLSPYIAKVAHGFDQHVGLLELAARNNSKRAFEAMVKNNIYGCLNYKSLNLMFGGENTSTLDKLMELKDVPNLDEYIALYKKLGGKTLAEMGYDKNRPYNDLELASLGSVDENSFGDTCSVQ